jgi:hypothetical protein
MMLIEADPIEPQFLHPDPGIQVLAVVPHGDVRAKILFGQGIGEFSVHLSVHLEVVHMLRIW